MSVTSPLFLSLATGALFFAGFVKGTVGFGITLIVVPVLAMVITPQEAIVLVSLPVFVMNFATALFTIREYREMRSIRWMLPVAFACVPFGVKVLLWVDPEPVRAVIGVMIIFFVGMRFSGWQTTRLSMRGETLFAVGMGALIGFLFGMIMMPVAFIIFYLNAIGAKREPFVFLLNVIASCLSLIQVSTFAWHSLYAAGAWRNSLLMLVPALAGLYVGTRFRQNLSERIFERLVLGLLAIAGMILIVRYGRVLL